MKKNIENLQLMILPGEPEPEFRHGDIYDRAFEFWLKYWHATCREIGRAIDPKMPSDDFLRHDIVNIIMHNSEVIGMINSTLIDFSVKSGFFHSFVLNYFDARFCDQIRNWKLARLLTLENIFLDSEWRSSKVGFSLGAVLMANAIKAGLDSGCDGFFGAPRKDAPTSRICTDLGAKILSDDLIIHGKPTALCLWRNIDVKKHPVFRVEEVADQLWSTRMDCRNTSTSNPLITAA